MKTHWASSVTGLVWWCAGYAGRKPASGSGGGDPKLDFQGTESLNTLRDRITQSTALTKCEWMTAGLPVWRRCRAGRARFGNDRRIDGGGSVLVIGNSVRLSIFARRDSINVRN